MQNQTESALCPIEIPALPRISPKPVGRSQKKNGGENSQTKNTPVQQKKVLPSVAFTFAGLLQVARYPKAGAKIGNISESCITIDQNRTIKPTNRTMFNIAPLEINTKLTKVASKIISSIRLVSLKNRLDQGRCKNRNRYRISRLHIGYLNERYHSIENL